MLLMLLLFAATCALAVRSFARLHAMEGAVADLTTRVRMLERYERIAPAPAPQPARAETPPVAAPDPRPAPPMLRPQASVTATPAPAVDTTPATTDGGARDPFEARIGSRWLLYAGVAAIVVGISYFEKLAIDSHWISETTRVVQGGVIGLVLAAAGLRFIHSGYRRYGQIIAGCGIAVQYVSVYAAFNFYHVIGLVVAFGLMAAVTMLAAWLADRERSQGLALVAAHGGFLTPFLLPSPTTSEVALFGYDTILIAGTALLARRRNWPALNLASYALTGLTCLAWCGAFYTPDKYVMTELFFTVFCAMFVYIRRRGRQHTHASSPLEQNILGMAPYLYYVASLAVLSGHSLALLLFLVLLAFVGGLIGALSDASTRLAFWAAAAVPLLLWSGAHGGRTWLAGGLAAWSAVYILNLAVLFHATLASDRRFTPADTALLHVNALVAYLGAYLLLEPFRVSACGPLAAGLAAAHGLASLRLATRWRDEALHVAALAFTFLTMAVAQQLDGLWLTAGLAAEGAVVTWLGLREQRAWLRAGGLLIFAVAIVRLEAAQFSAAIVGQLAFVNQRALCGAFIVGLTFALRAAHNRMGTGLLRLQFDTAVLTVVANLVTLSLLTSEISAFWELRDVGSSPAWGRHENELASQMMISLAWAVYATLLVVVGLRRPYKPIRYLGIAIFAVTMLKVVVIDLAELERVYRVLSVVGLGVMLLLTSYLYERLNRSATHA